MGELTKSAYVVLGLISKGPISGYGIKQIMAKMARFYWSESNAQIYPILKKLEQEKLVTSKVDAASGKRNKKIYTITDSGTQILHRWLIEPAPLTPYREELLLKVSQGQHMSKNELCAHFNTYRENIQTQLTALEDVLKHIKTDHAKRPDQHYLLMIYDHVKTLYEAKLAWSKKMLATMKCKETKND